MRSFFIFLFFALYAFCYAATGSETIDQALVFAESGRNDLAKELLRNLLRTSLTPDEQASALYNLASLLARNDQYKEALSTIESITPSLFDVAAKNSPLLGTCIAYDRAIYAVQIVKAKMRDHNISSTDLDWLQKLIFQAKESLDHAVVLAKKVSPNDSKSLTVPVMTHVAEEIAFQEEELTFAFFTNELRKLNKESLIEALQLFLYDAYMEISTLFDNDNSITQSYVEAYGQRRQKELFASIDQLLLFLQSPGKTMQAEINDFLIVQVERDQASIAAAFRSGSKEMLLEAISELSVRLKLVLSQVTKSDILTLLQDRVETLIMEKFSGLLLKQFWKRQGEERKLFLSQYLTEKGKLYTRNHDLFQAKLVESFRDYLKDRNTLLQAIEDELYWNVFSTPETEVLSGLVQELIQNGLENKQQLNFLLNGVADRLSVRISIGEGLENSKQALKSIRLAQQAASSEELLQGLIDSWRFIDPNSCFSFLFKQVQSKLSLKSGTSAIPSLTLLFRELTLFFAEKKDREVEALLQLVMGEMAFISQENSPAARQKVAFSEILLGVRFFESEVVERKKTFAELVSQVDEAVENQRQITALVRMAKLLSPGKEREDLSQAVQLFIRWQKRLLSRVMPLPELEKRKAVKELIEQAEKELIPSVDSLYKALELLEKAADLLHQESKNEQKKDEQKEETTKIEMKTANVTPDQAIRLLQEMQRDDMSLEEPKIKEKTGLRQW